MATFLLKSEPGTYSYADLVRDGETGWDGVRNALARRHLQAIAPGDRCYLYHSGDERRVVGVARACSGPEPDPTDPTGQWVQVRLMPVTALARPVTLAQFKAAAWPSFELVRMSRLSVMPVPAEIDRWIQEQAGTYLDSTT